jgi:hypothetical protein
METKKVCVHCKKTLVPIGSSRLNGAKHKDWENRKTHKKCYLQNQKIELYRGLFNQQLI